MIASVRSLEARRQLVRAYAAVAADPTDPEAHFQVGVALARQERYEEAADSFRRGQGHQPDDLRHSIAQSRALLLNQQPHEARLVFTPVYAARSDDPSIAHRMAFLILKDPKADNRALQRAVAIMNTLIRDSDQNNPEHTATRDALRARTGNPSP